MEETNHKQYMQQLLIVADSYEVHKGAQEVFEPFVMAKENGELPTKECLTFRQEEEFVVSKNDTTNILMYDLNNKFERAFQDR